MDGTGFIQPFYNYFLRSFQEQDLVFNAKTTYQECNFTDFQHTSLTLIVN